MKLTGFFLLLLLVAGNTYAATRYVDVTCNNPQYPYTTWETAATVIQDAVDASDTGDVVYVESGVYATGSTVTPGGVALNRVVIDKPISVLSVNGPAETIILGEGPISTNAKRCAYVGSFGSLSGFTLSNGFTSSTGHYHPNKIGGGAFLSDYACISNCYITRCESLVHGGGLLLRANTKATHCVIYDNKNYGDEGGAGCGAFLSGNVEMRDSLIYNNRPGRASGVCIRAGGMLINSTVCHNQGDGLELEAEGGAVNSIMYYNTGNNCKYGSNYTITNCCSYPLFAGNNNITNNPMFIDAGLHDYRLAEQSPCIDSGLNMAWMITATDLDGKKRIQNYIVDMGAYEYNNSIMTNIVWVTSPVPPPVVTTAPNAIVQIETESVSNGVAYIGYGLSPSNIIAWQEATVINGSSSFSAVADIRIQKPGTWYYTAKWLANDTEYYGWNADGQTNQYSPWAEYSIVVTNVQYHCVSQTSTNPVPPYANWATAATNIEDAVAVSVAGNTITVDDGIYNLDNELLVTNGILLRSMNGSDATVLSADGMSRCVFLSASNILQGFTVTNGYAQGGEPTGRGGGVCCWYGGEVKECHIIGNRADQLGGGVWCYNGGSVLNSVVMNNTADYGGGGGISCNNGGTIRNCLVVNNTAYYNGDGGGGGIQFRAGGGMADNCTVCDNTAGGIYVREGSATIRNSIAWYNDGNENIFGTSITGYFNCIQGWTTLTDGTISNAPLFIGATDYQLRYESPCNNAGTNLSWMAGAADLTGNPRIIGPAVDMGAYETVAEYINKDAIIKVKGKLNVKWLRDLSDSFAMVIECEAPTNFVLTTDLPYIFSFGGYGIDTDDLPADLVKMNTKNTALSFRSAKKQLPIISLKITSKKGLIKIIAKVKKVTLAQYFAAYGVDNTLKKGVVVTIPWHVVLGEWVNPVMQEPMMYKSTPDKKGSAKSL